MNPALKFIFARRSVRKYQNKDVSQEIVKDLLEAAMSAPSAVAKGSVAFYCRTRSGNAKESGRCFA